MSRRKKTPQRRSKPGVFRPATRVTEDELLEVESLLEAEDPDDADEAHMLVLDLEDKYPFDEVVLRLLFQTGLATEDYESMERAAVRLHRSHPRDPLVLISLGTAYLSATRPALTLRTWGTFIKLWPEREEAAEMRKEIEGLLGTRVFLELFVKVQDEWRSSRGFVEELDWRRQLEQIAEKQHRESKLIESRMKDKG